MKAARFQNSSRLQAVARLLSDGRWHPALDLSVPKPGYEVKGIRTVVCELRANGIAVQARRIGHSRHWEYRLGSMP